VVAVVELFWVVIAVDPPGTVSDGGGELFAAVVLPPLPQPATAPPRATQQLSAISRRSLRRTMKLSGEAAPSAGRSGSNR
jgi:hypothetical protein